MNFVGREAGEGRKVSDIFAVQQRVISRLAIILDDPEYGKAPTIPEDAAEQFRVFKAAMAAPPRMWATHPENSAREENAKRIYIPADTDQRSAWVLFENESRMRERMSEHIVQGAELEKTELAVSLKNLDKQFSKAYLAKKFHGAYLGRCLTRNSDNPEALYSDYKSDIDVDSELGQLYPKTLAGDLEKLRALYEEKAALEGIEAKTLKVNGGVIRHRDDEISRRDIPRVLEDLAAEIEEVELKINTHDKRCRTVHLALARQVGNGWEENLLGLIHLLHYANHSEANLRDVQGYVGNVIAVITADNRVSSSELKRLIAACDQAYRVLEEIYQHAPEIQLGGLVSKQMEIESWAESLGELELPPPSKENINDWVRAIDSWINSAAAGLNFIGTCALEQLLKVENFLEKHYWENQSPVRSPAAPVVPAQYSVLLEGQERKRQTRLGLWDRFYTADGVFAAGLRFAVAASIVGVVMFAGYFAGGVTVTVYNGLANTVKVDIDGFQATVPPHGHQDIILSPGSSHQVTATISGKIVEQFEAKTTGGFGDYVYNIAAASPMVEWTQTYGNASESPPKWLGAPRWLSTSADVLFEEPPDSVSTKSGGAVRTVLEGVSDIDPRYILQYVDAPDIQMHMARQHAIWDFPSPHLYRWVNIASNTEEVSALMRERIQHFGPDVLAMRLILDFAADEAEYRDICGRYQSSAQQHPQDADLQYLAIRCLDDESEKDQRFVAGEQRWPENAWFHFAAAQVHQEQGDWEKAGQSIERLIASNHVFSEPMVLDYLRLQRRLGRNSEAAISRWAERFGDLDFELRLETGERLEESPYRFYTHLNAGDLQQASTVLSEMEDEQSRGLRLLAASEGASSDLIRAAGALPPQEGVDRSTVWLCWAQALRNGEDVAPYEAVALESFDDARLMLSVLKKVQKLGPYTAFEQDLVGLDLRERGYVYLASYLLLQQKAPVLWKQRARQLLLTSERPHIAIDKSLSSNVM